MAIENPAQDARAGPPGPPGYETRDTNFRGPAIFVAAMFAGIALILVSLGVLFRYYSQVQKLGPPASPFENARPLPPVPRLQPDPPSDLRQLREREDQILNSYGWVDQKAGVVRIPIAQAMKQLLQKGLPARKPPAPEQ